MVTVLFIDNDPAAHRTLDLVLPEPYRLISAYTGRQGIEAAAREGPDVVLLDIHLPDMDGISALRRIAAGPVPPPVVMLTASTIRQQRASLGSFFSDRWAVAKQRQLVEGSRCSNPEALSAKATARLDRSRMVTLSNASGYLAAFQSADAQVPQWPMTIITA